MDNDSHKTMQMKFDTPASEKERMEIVENFIRIFNNAEFKDGLIPCKGQTFPRRNNDENF